MTDEEADLTVLSKANHKRKFGVPFGVSLPSELQFAFERGIDNDWFRLVDIAPIAALPSNFIRLFKLTDVGVARLTTLKGQANPQMELSGWGGCGCFLDDAEAA